MALAGLPKSPNPPPVKQERYTTEQVRDALRQARGLVTVAARTLACDPSTVRAYINRHPTVAAAVREAREGVLDMAEGGLIQSIRDREPWAIKYYLSTQGRERGYVEKHDVNVTGSYTIDLGGEDDGSTSTV